MLHNLFPAGILASGIVVAWLGHHPAVADDRPGGTDKGATGFVADVGEYRLQDGRVRVKVSKTKAGQLEYGLTFADETGRPRHTVSDALTKKGRGWFIYASSPEVVWVFDGEKRLAAHNVAFTGENKAEGQTDLPRSPAGRLGRAAQALSAAAEGAAGAAAGWAPAAKGLTVALSTAARSAGRGVPNRVDSSAESIRL